MTWYEEQHHKLSVTIARLEAIEWRLEREIRSSAVADDLRRVGLLPASQQADQGHQCADGVKS